MYSVPRTDPVGMVTKLQRDHQPLLLARNKIICLMYYTEDNFQQVFFRQIVSKIFYLIRFLLTDTNTLTKTANICLHGVIVPPLPYPAC